MGLRRTNPFGNKVVVEPLIDQTDLTVHSPVSRWFAVPRGLRVLPPLRHPPEPEVVEGVHLEVSDSFSPFALKKLESWFLKKEFFAFQVPSWISPVTTRCQDD